MTPFEQKLADTPRREIPPEWRANILAAAQPRKSFPALTSSVSASLRLLISTFQKLFQFPHPLAWGAVAAAWLVIAALNFSGPRGEELYAVTPKEFRGKQPDVRLYLAQLAAQRYLLAGYTDDPELSIEFIPFPRPL